MRGPLLLLLTLAGVTTIAVCVFLPIHSERLEYEAGILERAARWHDASDPGRPAQIARLTAALSLPRDGEAAVNDVRGLLLDFAPLDRIEIEGPVLEFPAAWRDVPGLLARLGRRKGIVFRSFSAVPTKDPERCRITLELVAPDQGNEDR